MYKLNRETIKDISDGMVYWAKRIPYYDAPWLVKDTDTSMYVVALTKDDYFLGCPLVGCNKNVSHYSSDIVLERNKYPLKYDSAINLTLYKVYNNQTIGNRCFNINSQTLAYLKKKIYERIAINHIEGDKTYMDIFADKYMEEHKPLIKDIIVYPCDDHYETYYITNLDNDNYYLLKADKLERNLYQITSNDIVKKPKSLRYYDYHTDVKIYR